ncbi:phage baseplate protein [Flindersiella endophytica]
MTSSKPRRFELSRRQLLGGAAAVTAGAAIPALTATPALASLPDSPEFDLSGNGGYYFLQKELHQPYWAMQSFAFDNVNQRIYFAQKKPKEQMVPGTFGDIWLTKTDLSGNILGTMALRGFGHGSSMGVEPVGAGSEPFIWIEADSWRVHDDTKEPYDIDDGEKVARFRFVDGHTLDYRVPDIPMDDLTPKVTSFSFSPRPAIDPYASRVLYRYHSDDSDHPWRVVVFSLADARAGRLSDGYRLAERAIPTNNELGLLDSDQFQGITLCGRYAYLSFGATNANPWLVKLDMNGGLGLGWSKFRTSAGENTLSGREAEGMAIRMTGGSPQLAFGFSSRNPNVYENFWTSVFYKSDFV